MHLLAISGTALNAVQQALSYFRRILRTLHLIDSNRLIQ